MNREEAILLLHDMKDTYDEIHENTNGDLGYEQMTALDMAIEALHREEAEEKGYCHRIMPSNVEVVVRCKDCRHSRVYQTDSKGTMQTYCVAFVMSRTVTDDDYCSWGERREP